MYNVLEKLRRGEPLSAKDKAVHEQGLVSVLRQIHDDLDAAVAAAYGWPTDPAALPDDEILRRLIALNADRAAEERRGLVRWLRPDFQNPAGPAAPQPGLDLPEATRPAKPKPAARQPWPAALPEQARAVRAALAARGAPATAAEVAAVFEGRRKDRVAELLETLAGLGQARAAGDGRYAG